MLFAGESTRIARVAFRLVPSQAFVALRRRFDLVQTKLDFSLTYVKLLAVLAITNIKSITQKEIQTVATFALPQLLK